MFFTVIKDQISVVRSSREFAAYWEVRRLGHLPIILKEMDKLVERFNRTLEAIFAKTVKESQRDWDSCLQKALFAYRTSLHEATGFTPFHLVHPLPSGVWKDS